MTSGIIVHGIAGSPYVRAALLALEEKGADYELRQWRQVRSSKSRI